MPSMWIYFEILYCKIGKGLQKMGFSCHYKQGDEGLFMMKMEMRLMS